VLILLPLSVDQIAILLALFKLAAVPVFIDPAMGLRLFLALVAEAAPTAMIGMPFVHLLRLACPRSFRSVRCAVTSGRKWSANLYTLSDLRAAPATPVAAVPAQETDEAAIIFTTGSTGTPKGVVYSVGTLRAQLYFTRPQSAFFQMFETSRLITNLKLLCALYLFHSSIFQ
jgi:acyl-CoA synthetase (AMP-forming)/AMP-acid ligase II